jgi:flavin-binding protein dodecin
MVELVGVSEESVDRAVRNAVARAGASLTGLGWFEVSQIRGLIKDDQVSQYQVTVKLGFRILTPQEVGDAKRARRTAELAGAPSVWEDDHF